MCEYCDKVNNKHLTKLDDHDEGVEIFIEYRKNKGGELIAVGSYDTGYGCVDASINIKYCPMCGRKL